MENISFLSLVANIFFIVATIIGICGIILRIKDWWNEKIREKEQNHYQNK